MGLGSSRKRRPVLDGLNIRKKKGSVKEEEAGRFASKPWLESAGRRE